MQITKKFSRTVFTVLVVLLAAVLGACSAGGGMPSYQGEAGAPQATQAAGGSAPDQDKSYPQAPQDQTERMVILTQTLRLKVDDTAATIAAVREVADKHSAIVANMRKASEGEWVYDSPAGSYTPLRGWLTVRVPVDGVKAFVDEVSGLGEVVYQAETSDDVTQDHVDLSARLENLRAQETRLRELVAQAANVEETLAVEQELWRVRGEIESLDAQVKYLERQAAMATITVELAEEGPVVQNWGFVEALKDGIRAAAAVLAFTISFTIATSPLWILGLVIFFLVRRARRNRASTRPPKVKPGRTRHVQPEPAPAAQTGATAAPKPEATPEA